MERLQRVLATGVLEALRVREHVVVAPASADALCDEVEAIITPSVGKITESDAAVSDVVEQIAAQLLTSDHVDDVFAEDRVIVRDTYKAIRNILVGYIRGEIEVADGRVRDTFQVSLDELGYVVTAVSRRLEQDMLRDALERAAAAVGGRLLALEPSRAHFDLPGGAEVGRLAIEESVTEELVALVEAELVDLPRVEQVLELAPDTSSTSGFADAIARAEARTRSETSCAASCQLVDRSTLIATLVPLDGASAEAAEDLFSVLLGHLERELNALPAPTKKPASGRRRSRASGARAPEPSPPESRPRGKKKAPASRASRTRSKTKRPTKKTKKAKG